MAQWLGLLRARTAPSGLQSEACPPTQRSSAAPPAEEKSDTTGAKDLGIETLRGLAILLVVMGHVIGDSSTSGLRVADDSPYRYFYESLRLLRMPLFTAISGYVYALRPLSAPGRWPGFFAGKARRLLLPMAVVGTLEFVLRAVTPGVNHRANFGDLWRVYVFGYDHFWFLQAVFAVIVVSAALDAHGLLRTRGRWTLALAAAFFAALVLPRVAFFSFGGTLYLAPFFLLGVGLRRFELASQRTILLASTLVLLHGIAHQQWAWFSGDLTRLDASSVTGLTASLGGAVLLFAFRRTSRALAWLGSYAFSIYLFHVLGTAPARMLTRRLLGERLADPTPLLLLASLVAGLVLPIVLEKLLAKNAWSSLLFLGQRAPRPRPSGSARSRPSARKWPVVARSALPR